MYYLLYGSDIGKARAKMHELVDSLLTKKRDASVVSMNEETFDGALLESFIRGQGLFEAKQIAILDNIFLKSDAKELIMGKRKELHTSPNVFFIVAQTLDKATVTKLEKYAEKTLLFGEALLKKGGKMRAFNTFALADAFGMRDRKKLWVLYIKGRRSHCAPEELHGVLFWQAKNMLTVCHAKSAQEAGLNPFVFQKALSFIKNYSETELQSSLKKLVTLTHDARRGLHDLDTAMEHFILEL